MDLLSECCSAHHDHRFSFDDEWNMGVCSDCKEHSEFKKSEEE